MLPVQRLTATVYHRKMGSGRTKPVLLGCEDENGNAAGEFVVKLKGGVNNGVTGLTCELLSSLVARLLGIAVPEPALITLDTSLAEVVPARDVDVAEIALRSEGANFGARLLTGGYRIWPVDMAIPSGLRQTAAEVFALDALIQNPDRRYDNPNLLWRDEEIFVIDHESAFSFIYALGGGGSPLDLESLAFLGSHVFYRGLKGEIARLGRFLGALQTISDEVISEIADEVPQEWRTGYLAQIIEHLRLVRDHAAEFGEQVNRRLA